MTQTYRTLVRGKLVQLSSLCAGGSAAEPGGPDIQCARDGRGRLTIPGSGLAGALVETAGRIFPDLFRRDDAGNKPGRLWDRISAKSRAWGKGRSSDPPEGQVFQSLWRFHAAHLSRDYTEMRQGVGIRQETGAAAGEARALFDAETVPPGEAWDLFLEIDTYRGGPRLEAVALLALAEWARGRCWLGASAARGLGWMELAEPEVLRLPLTEEAVDAWPDNRGAAREDTWRLLAGLKDVTHLAGAKALQDEGTRLWGADLPPGRFCYLTLDGELSAGPSASGYGWDAVSVGGHEAGFRAPVSDRLLVPAGVNAGPYRADEYRPDAPVVTSGRDEGSQKPLVPGSGVRGPLRHAASRWHRQGRDVVDPNVNRADRGDRRHETSDDPVSVLFGLTGQSARLLVRDARLVGDEYVLAWLQHHAEDEFAGGVYGSGKFDRTAVLSGQFGLRLVVEAPDPAALRRCLDTLKPALRLAELGFVRLGGAKQRGSGGATWRFTRVSVGRAGQASREWKVSPGMVVANLDEAGRLLQEASS